jgi:hypothetical protein
MVGRLGIPCNDGSIRQRCQTPLFWRVKDGGGGDDAGLIFLALYSLEQAQADLQERLKSGDSLYRNRRKAALERHKTAYPPEYELSATLAILSKQVEDGHEAVKARVIAESLQLGAKLDASAAEQAAAAAEQAAALKVLTATASATAADLADLRVQLLPAHATAHADAQGSGSSTDGGDTMSEGELTLSESEDEPARPRSRLMPVRSHSWYRYRNMQRVFVVLEPQRGAAKYAGGQLFKDAVNFGKVLEQDLSGGCFELPDITRGALAHALHWHKQ